MRAAADSAPIETIRAMLLARMRELAERLAPDKAHVIGHTRWSLNPARADRTAGSFKIDVSGPKAGRWYEFAGGFGGDAIDLISYVRVTQGGPDYQSRENRGKAITWARAWLGLDGPGRQDWRQAEAEAEAFRVRLIAERRRALKEEEAKAARCRAEWLAAAPDIWTHDVARRYLCAARGIEPALIVNGGGALRFETDGPPAPWTKHDAETGEIFPAIATCAVNGRGRITGLHRTFLTPDGAGKAPIRHEGKVKSKFMYGRMKGSALRLTKGTSRDSPERASRAGVTGETLAISEGIEDGLSWAMMEPGHRVHAAGSISLIGLVPVHPCIGRIVLVAQNDEAAAARAAFERQAEHLIERTGLPVECVFPPAEFKDWNDCWRAAR